MSRHQPMELRPVRSVQLSPQDVEDITENVSAQIAQHLADNTRANLADLSAQIAQHIAEANARAQEEPVAKRQCVDSSTQTQEPEPAEPAKPEQPKLFVVMEDDDSDEVQIIQQIKPQPIIISDDETDEETDEEE